MDEPLAKRRSMMFSTKRRITTNKRNWFANRLYTFGNKNKYPFAKKGFPVSSKKLFTPWPGAYLTSNYVRTTIKPTLDSLYMTLPWKNIDVDLFKTLNVTSASTRVENLTLRNILSNISDMQHNLSVYLIQNLSIFDNNHYATAENKTKGFFGDIAFTTKALRTPLLRAETGYNIILIIHLLSASTLQEACSQNEDQLIVYELGETFGGYWGHLPDTMMMKKTDGRRNYTKFYTIKTTQSTITERTHTDTEDTVKILMETFPATDKEPDYITMEVPLVNVSGNLQLGGPIRHTYNSEEMFDFIYDVTPRNGSQYETSIMPLVQFSMRQQKGYEKSRYELDYSVNDFTMDPRSMMFSTKRRITTNKRNWFVNRLYTFGNKNKYPFAKKGFPVSSKKLFTPWPGAYLTSNYVRTTIKPTLDSLYMTLPWKNIDVDLFKTLNVTSASTRVENLTLRNILSNISDMQHNLSVYLIQNLSIFDNNHYATAENKTKGFFGDIAFTTKALRTPLLRPVMLQKYESTTIPQEHKVLRNMEAIISDNNITTLLLIEMNSTQLNNHDYDSTTDGARIILTTTMSNTPILKNGTLVNHESWENVVQSAPIMAIILNKTELSSKHFYNKTHLNKSVRQPSKLRKKRNIQAVPIEKSRPQNIATQKNMFTEDEPSNELSEMQDLARLVELQDDEMQGCVALRYLQNYVGPVLFNICDFREAEARQMFLFNASRIVIAINNFTLHRMMLVLTPAVTLFDTASECPPAHLECQITGTRVCIDSLNACDGVPNCGTYDIYDEDRLLCGVAKGLQHNVYLAAFTFLAVLLTMLYTVHYWLKRCVPRVSEAFFVFSDTSENTLILDTIMRSPTDIDDNSYKCVYSGAFFDNSSLPDYKERVGKSNIFTKIYKACCGFLLCRAKTSKKDQPQELTAKYDSNVDQSNKMFSFTELELRKYALVFKDEGVQTSDSIERVLEINKRRELRKKQHAKSSFAKFKIAKGQGTVRDNNNTDELNLIKMAKEKKSSISQIASTSEQNPVINERRHALSPDDEKEIKSTVYERSSTASLISDKIPVTCEIHPEKTKKSDTSKRLRFDESPTMITSVGYEKDITEASSSGHMHSRDKFDLSTIIETDNGSSSKAFMKFWNSKSKKQKK